MMNLLLLVFFVAAASEEAAKVTHLPAAQVSAALQKPPAPLTQGSNYTVMAIQRTKAGQSEVHDRDTDVFYVIDGGATFVTGGRMIEAKTVSLGEHRGSGIEEGTSRHIAKGDVLTIAPGTPHWFKTVEGSVTYFVVKVR